MATRSSFASLRREYLAKRSKEKKRQKSKAENLCADREASELKEIFN